MVWNLICVYNCFFKLLKEQSPTHTVAQTPECQDKTRFANMVRCKY